MSERKRPALDRAVETVTKLRDESLCKAWSPKRLRTALRDARNACKPVWRLAIRRVFQAGVRELPDTRQLDMFGGW